MRIGVLEWASSGGGSIGAWEAGAQRCTPSSLPTSIVEEGWAMTRATIESLTAAGYEVSAGLLPDLAGRLTASPTAPWAPGLISTIDVSQPIKRQWQAIYGSCDATIVIAPESDGVLEKLIKWCRRRSIATCNAEPEFIRRATDKWYCAVQWKKRGLPHPATRRMDQVTQPWLAAAADRAREQSNSEPLFVIKPRDGVGCEGIRRVSRRDVLSLAGKFQRLGCASNWLVQPWLEGIACSRAAIVDRQGQKQWLPVAGQRLSIGQHVTYRGGSVEAADWHSRADITECLESALNVVGEGAAGWIGVDFVYHPITQSITLIEINPRLTTSFVELRRVVDAGLAGKLVEACLDRPRPAP